jgi:Fe-S-cluster containining protein
VDELTARLQTRYSKHLVCRAGCSGCCHHHLSVFAVEADEIRRAIEAASDQTRARIEAQARAVIEREALGEEVACPLLLDDRCSIYESRPLICRTQGLPLLIEAEDGEQEVDFCPLNFAEASAVDDLSEERLIPLDALNLRLALVNLRYCREAGLSDEASGQRLKMADIVLKSRISHPKLGSHPDPI